MRRPYSAGVRSGGSRPSNKGGGGRGGGHPDPEIREGRAPLLDPPLVRKANFDCIFKLPAWPICRETG